MACPTQSGLCTVAPGQEAWRPHAPVALPAYQVSSGCMQPALHVGTAPPCTSWARPRHCSASVAQQGPAGGVRLGMSSCTGGERGLDGSVAAGAFLGPDGVLQLHTSSELHWCLPPIFPAGIFKVVGAALGVTAQPQPSLPLCQCSYPWEGSSELLDELCAVLVP